MILKIVWPYKRPFAALKKEPLDLINTYLRSSKKKWSYNRTNAEEDFLRKSFIFHSIVFCLAKKGIPQKGVKNLEKKVDLIATHLRKKTFCWYIFLNLDKNVLTEKKYVTL